MRILLTLMLLLLAVTVSSQTSASVRSMDTRDFSIGTVLPHCDIRTANIRIANIRMANIRMAQGGGKTLQQAIEQIKRQTGGKVLSAETRTEGGRKVHHIRVLIDDKTVKTFKVPGQ